MSLLQQLRNKRRPRGVRFLENVSNRVKKIEEEALQKARDQVERDRMVHIEKIKEEEKKERENIKKVNESREEVMKQNITEENEKDTNIIKNTTLNSLITGFLSTKDKPKYIKKNSKAFKALNHIEQQTLYNLYLRYL